MDSVYEAGLYTLVKGGHRARRKRGRERLGQRSKLKSRNRRQAAKGRERGLIAQLYAGLPPAKSAEEGVRRSQSHCKRSAKDSKQAIHGTTAVHRAKQEKNRKGAHGNRLRSATQRSTGE